jgi:hypothetical protein
VRERGSVADAAVGDSDEASESRVRDNPGPYRAVRVHGCGAHGPFSAVVVWGSEMDPDNWPPEVEGEDGDRDRDKDENEN